MAVDQPAVFVLYDDAAVEGVGVELIAELMIRDCRKGRAAKGFVEGTLVLASAEICICSKPTEEAKTLDENGTLLQ